MFHFIGKSVFSRIRTVNKFNDSFTGTHFVHEIIGILLSGKLESLPEYNTNVMLELIPEIATLDERPSPRLVNTHMRLKFLPTPAFNTVSHYKH